MANNATERARGMAQAAGLAHRAMELLTRVDQSLMQIARQTQTRADNAINEGASAGGSPVGVPGAAQNGWNGPHMVDANPDRRGLTVQNTGATVITLGLGQNSPTPGQGIVLAAGASWDGRISGALWKGSVTPVSSAVGGQVAWVEV